MWVFEEYSDAYFRIRNQWQPSIYINIEYGDTNASEIQPGWYSAIWKKFTFTNNSEFIDYYSFDNRKYSLKPYDGRNISLMVDDAEYDESTINEIVAVLDNAFDQYKFLTGKTPELLKHKDGLLSIAIVDDDDSCGAGCGYLGHTGIEIRKQFFQNLYYQKKENNYYDQIPFYELGRNFWFYGDKIDRNVDLPSSSGAITTGYAVFMRFYVMEKLGINGIFNNENIEIFKETVKGILPTYLDNQSLNFLNTIAQNKSPTPNTEATDLFASFLFSMQDQFGDKFIEDLWKVIGNRANANSSLNSTDNFIVVASIAANRDLRELFKKWKWPELGMQANEELDGRFKVPSILPIILLLLHQKF